MTIIDLLRRAEVQVVTAGLEEGPVTASRGTRLLPDTRLEEVSDQEFEMIVLPGGLPGAIHLEKDARLREMLVRHRAAGRYTAAICAAPKVLASAGLLDGKTATSYPGTVIAADFPRANLVEAPLVVDGTVVTGRGPGSAMDFALQLIELLQGRDRRDQVESALLRAV